MARILLLLTNGYPYGAGEPFVGTELPFLVPHFDRVVVIASQVQDDSEKRHLPLGVECWAVQEPRTRRARLISFLNGSKRSLATGSGRRLLGSGLPFAALRAEAAFEARAQSCWAQLRSQTDDLALSDGDEVTVYSYWLHHTARVGELLAARLRERFPTVSVRFISRAHGYDLYEERHPLGRLPQRHELVAACDAIYPVSKNGEKYLRDRHPNCSDKIEVRHLGTIDPAPMPSRTNHRLHVTTCATVTPVKRLDRVPAVVELVAQKGVEVVWTHIGTGPGLAALQSLAREDAPTVTVRFLGQVDNEDLFQIYQENPSTLFLSLSSSEGVPVSMMEAISGGIPIVSTDVGGVSDLVVPGRSGHLIAKDFTDSQAADALLKVWQLPDAGYEALCTSTRQWWHESFRAATAYTRFVDDLRPS